MKISEGRDIIAETLWQIKDKKDFLRAIIDLLSPGEIIEISTRIMILKMLKNGIGQREIAEKLGISITTVSRGSRLLKYESKSIKKYI